MSMSSRWLSLIVVGALAATAQAQPKRMAPHIGYLYPAGGQQGTVVLVTAGGQFLRGAREVYVSGEGARAKIIKYYRPIRNLQKAQREDLRRRLKEATEKRLAELPGRSPALEAIRERRNKKGNAKSNRKQDAGKTKQPAGKKAAKKAPFRPVEHPLLYNLESKSLRELRHVAHEIFFPRRKKQLNVQIAEMALIEVTIAPDASPGDREIRIATPFGLSNPMVFQIGQLPEIRELEPNDPKDYPNLPKAYTKMPMMQPADLPVLLNGRIMPGDVDRFRIRAKRGQRLVIEAQARRLVPFLADAVPGWFQATIALYDIDGNELAFADDYLFSPDPVLFYEIPHDGIYEVEIRDAIYRGREDFIYRVAVGEQPFIKWAFPLGGRVGVETVASLGGWNLSKTLLRLDTQPGDFNVRQAALGDGGYISNEVTYAVDSLPECVEAESNDTVEGAQKIKLPRIVNGRIERTGDVDFFQFEGKAGDEVVAEVLARRLRSPLDSLLRLTDASGRVLAWNDDHDDKDGYLHKDMGYITHHADSYLRAKLPQDGLYYVKICDSQNHGGEAYGYRLRVSRPRPDFSLRVTPSSISVRAGRAAPMRVYALRKDGFDGDIRLVLKDAPPGFDLSGGRILAGRDSVRITLTAPLKPLREPVSLHIEGRAEIDGKTISHIAIPSEDMMQAFLYRHLAPSQELMTVVMPSRARLEPIELADASPVRIAAGGKAMVRIKVPMRPALRNIEFELDDPPDGVALQKVIRVSEGMALVLKADSDTAKLGAADNLIVEAFAKIPVRKQGKQKGKAKRKLRVSLGVLPAIPLEIVKR